MDKQTIWKFGPLKLGLQQIQMPAGAQVLAAKLQDHQVYLWALVYPSKKLINWNVGMAGTGHLVDDLGRLRFVDTVIEGSYAWHVFVEVKNEL